MGNIRKELAKLLTDAWEYAEEVCAEKGCRNCLRAEDPADECLTSLAVDYMIAHGVTVQRERELVCVTKTGPSEAVYFRKIYFCPSCDTEIGDELLDVNTERVFGHGTVMKDNKFPKCCPECGTRIVIPAPPKGE